MKPVYASELTLDDEIRLFNVSTQQLVDVLLVNKIEKTQGSIIIHGVLKDTGQNTKYVYPKSKRVYIN